MRTTYTQFTTDKNKDRKVSTEGLLKSFTKIGYTDDTVEDSMKILDSNKDGVLCLKKSSWSASMLARGH